MSDEAILKRMEWTEEDRQRKHANVSVFNHSWDGPTSLETLGAISAKEIEDLSGGLFSMDVPVQSNRKAFSLLVHASSRYKKRVCCSECCTSVGDN